MRNKLQFINESLIEHSLDIFFICESWLHDSEKDVISAALPKQYSFRHVPRSQDPSDIGGGVAIIFKSNCFSSFKILPNFHINTSFEILACTFYINNIAINTAVIYRPGYPGTDLMFLQEFNEFLSVFSELGTHFFLCGDFNYWVNNPSGKPFTSDFLNSLDAHSCINSVNGPTHSAGNTLDLIIHDSENTLLTNIITFPIDNKYSDHSLITFNYNIPIKPPAKPKVIKFRNYNKKNLENLKLDITTAFASTGNINFQPIELVNNFNTMLSLLHENNFPLIEKSIKVQESNPWFDSSISKLRRDRRIAERHWRHSRSETSRLKYITARSLVVSEIEEKKKDYFTSEIINCELNQKKLWNVISKLTGCPEHQYPSNITSNEINEFFINKIEKLRKDLDSITISETYSDVVLNYTTSNSPSVLNQFLPVTECDVLKLVNSQNKTSCSLDPFNFTKIPEILPLLVPIFTIIINACFSLGVFPNSEKIALVRPLLKKPNLDKDDLNNYRPVSNLTYLSKLIERAILNQLNPHLNKNKRISDFQSAYRQHHSTETALCRIYNDLLLNTENSASSLLILLDLSAAFDTIDHNLLLKDLKDSGINGNALLLVDSYLNERFQKVSLNDSVSKQLKLSYGVPQGSVLGPVLFSLYSSKLAMIMSAHDVRYHLYADDTQIYMPITNVASTKSKITNIISDIKLWMHERKLKLNEGKTEVILIKGPLNNEISIDSEKTDFIKDILPSNSVRDLGLILDSKLSFKSHINSVIKTCNFQLRRLSCIMKYLNKETATTLIHAFITSRVDYCNSLFINLPKKDLTRLQSILNRAARLIYKLPSFTSTSPYLYELHWLPIKARIEFKVCLLVFKALRFNQPSYLYDLFTRYTPQSNMTLRAADDPYLLVVPRLNKHSSFTSRSISYAGPLLFNKLPFNIKDSNNTVSFKKLLKTYLFEKAYDSTSKSINIEYRT